MCVCVMNQAEPLELVQSVSSGINVASQLEPQNGQYVETVCLYL